MDFIPKVGMWVERVKFSSKYLAPGKAYQIVSVQADQGFSEGLKISLADVQAASNGGPRWFDPSYFAVAEVDETALWVAGAKVVCVNPDNIMGWSPLASICQDGETYTLKGFNIAKSHILVEENQYMYKKTAFKLADAVGPFYSKPKPKTVIYNKQGS